MGAEITLDFAVELSEDNLMLTPHYVTRRCHECHGSTFTCATCGKPGDLCQCDDDQQEAVDCQNCQGEGTEDMPLCAGCDAELTSTDFEAGACTQCGTVSVEKA